MKIIVTHLSPDWDAIGGVWVIKKYLPGWEDATVEFVPAGERSERVKDLPIDEVIQYVKDNEIIHVDTGMGPLDHHQTSDKSQSGTGRAWEYVLEQREKTGHNIRKSQEEAVDKIVRFIVSTDHFQEVFWPEAASDRYDLTILGILEGMKYMKPEKHQEYVDFGIDCLNALVHTFENKIWAERELKEKGVEFEAKMGKGIALETENDTVLKLAQKMGYMFVVRKDPDKGYIRIKVRPSTSKEDDIDLTGAYEEIKKQETSGDWFLHVSKKMLLNGGSKNPTQKSSSLSIQSIIEILQKLY